MLFRSLQWRHSETFELHNDLIEDRVLPLVLLVDIFESLSDNLKLVFQVVLSLLDISKALLSLKVLSHFGLQIRNLFGQF